MVAALDRLGYVKLQPIPLEAIAPLRARLAAGRTERPVLVPTGNPAIPVAWAFQHLASDLPRFP